MQIKLNPNQTPERSLHRFEDCFLIGLVSRYVFTDVHFYCSIVFNLVKVFILIVLRIINVDLDIYRSIAAPLLLMLYSQSVFKVAAVLFITRARNTSKLDRCRR